MQAKGAGPPHSYERYLQPAVKPPRGDATHAGRHAGAVIRLDCGICGQLHSAALQLSEPPTEKTVQVTMGRERANRPGLLKEKHHNVRKLQLLQVIDVLGKKVKPGYSSPLFTCMVDVAANNSGFWSVCSKPQQADPKVHIKSAKKKKEKRF